MPPNKTNSIEVLKGPYIRCQGCNRRLTPKTISRKETQKRNCCFVSILWYYGPTVAFEQFNIKDATQTIGWVSALKELYKDHINVGMYIPIKLNLPKGKKKK
jgi:hypothetical protein